MATIQKSLRMPSKIASEVEDLAKASGRDFSSMANELLAEAVKMRRCPGVIFADGPSGRRPRLAGTGLDVWEVIATYQSLNRDLDRLRQAYHWLSDAHLRAALGYYSAYPEEIDRQIARNEAWTPSRLAERHPSLVAERR
ncbi:MAG: DUF433 domain-containing protein [Chloroflexi bacterium]|nr:DUF433 domain-containing protein [Chloroflexota bacterium]